MSYESYYESERSIERLFNDHRFKLYYLLFVVLLVTLSVVATLVGFPTVAGMLLSYIVLFTVVSGIFVVIPYLILREIV